MMCPRLILVALFAIACAPLDDRTVSAQTVEELFDDHVIHDVRLFINERDLQELRNRYREDLYVPADFEWRGQRVRNVGVRPRGLATRSPMKLGLKVDFNRYAAGQSFLGHTALVLDNLLQDPSLVRERLSMALFERLGEPASRESFARVYINNSYEGIFAIVEPVDGEFLTRTRGNKTGYLFERHFQYPYYGEDLGDDPASYRTVFQPRNHELESDTILYSPIRDLFHEVNQPLDTVWRERVSRYIDLEQFVTHVAIETYLSELDGVLGFAGMANFYLYRETTGDRHQLIVWDKDQTFAAIDSPIFQRASENILFSRVLSFGDLRALYLDALERCARSAAADGWLESEIGRLSTLVEAPAREDVRKPFDEATRQASVEFLLRFARERSAFVLREVARELGER
jgi:spore coat protein H